MLLNLSKSSKIEKQNNFKEEDIVSIMEKKFKFIPSLALFFSALMFGLIYGFLLGFLLNMHLLITISVTLLISMTIAIGIILGGLGGKIWK